MKVYETKDIRNVAVLGHGSAGKTTVVESAAYVTGVISRMGKVTDGTTISDFDKEEQKRTFSISTSVVPIEYEGKKINLLDTPGYFDFVGEAEEAVSAADAAVIVVNGKAGVQVGVQKAWDLCEQNNLPRLFFVTNMDDANANYARVCADLKEAFGTRVVPFQVPIRDGEKFAGFVNVPKMQARRFADNKGAFTDCDIPADVKDLLDETHAQLMEAVAETDEELMERYFMEDEFTPEEIAEALNKAVSAGDVVPVLMGSGLNSYGVSILLHDIDKYFPSPAACKISGVNQKTDETFEADYDESKAPTAKVFKTLIDPFIGKYSFIKVCSGVLKGDSVLYNVNKETEEKVARLYLLRGKEAIEVPELHAGDIGAIAKMLSAGTGDSLASKAEPIAYPKPEISVPYTYQAYRGVNKGDEDKIATSLTKLMEEDLTLKTVNDKENRQLLIYGIGDQQLEVVMSKLEARYKVKAELYKPKVAYRETIRGSVHVQGKHKKQSGGHGQYGDVVMDFEPSGDLDTPYIFEEKIVGGVVPKNYFPAVEKGLQEMVVKGPLAGYPIVGLKASLVFGSYHPVDSSEMAFKLATHLAVKNCFADKNSRPCLLEPIATVKVKVPDKFTGDVMGDMNKRRGRVLGMTPDHKGNQIIEADCPMSELYGYNTDLRSMTGGIGSFTYEFARYEQAPQEIQDKEVAARAAEQDEE
ncbi:MAG: elongation factor G [Lachnospiraceae bacterium]|nr:elongation factor G [Lachnospiraceae bacterium]